jgi:hypothetical protein
MSQGITFTVYGEKEGLERIFPFDFVPRILPAAEWKLIQDGLVQRITTLNLFLLDIYQEQKCLKDRIVPPELILSRKEYKRGLLGVGPPRKVFTHVVGTDIIRNDKGVPPNKGIDRGNAEEALDAQVITRVAARKDVSALHEEMEQIDLPVFQEIPERRRERDIIAAEEAAAQQQ